MSNYVEVATLIEFLRNSVNIQMADVNDPVFLSMSDETVGSYINIAVSRDFPQFIGQTAIPGEYMYPVALLAKKELYYALATISAPLYSLGADNNNYLKRTERFDHYLKLIQQIDGEYRHYIENGGAGSPFGTLTSHDVLLSNRFYTTRNYELGVKPIVSLKVDSMEATQARLSWSVSFRHFAWYKVYLSDSPIFDLYAITDKISKSAVLKYNITDARQLACKFEGLTPGTLYHAGIEIAESSGLKGFSEITFSTP